VPAHTSRRSTLIAILSCALATVSVARPAIVGAAPSPTGTTYNVVWDDFSKGFTVGDVGTAAKWFYFGAGPFVGNDGVATTSNKGLRVAPPATNPATGLPAFSLTLGQEGASDNPFGLPGGIDHVKWLVYANAISSAGYPGFDAVPGRELTFDSWVNGQSYGNEQHPFGSAVADPDDDIRLAASAMPTIDFETYLVSDFFLTNKRIYAVYERLPFGRTATDNYAAFTYAIPVADRKPGQQHHLTIGYDRSANVIRWLVNDVEVFRVTRPGFRLPSRQYMILDHGGEERDVACRQRDLGLGMFTLLDAGNPSQQALVQLSSAPGFYFSTTLGSPTPQTFLDPLSQPGSRIWGEGAVLQVQKVRIASQRPMLAQAAVAGGTSVGSPIRFGIHAEGAGSLGLSFSLPTNKAVRLEVFDVSGRLVSARDLTSVAAGAQSTTVTLTRSLGRGVYLARLTQGSQSATRKFAYIP
jgi:uncharacterized protein DUF6081